jgi:hypothetical protein
LPFNSSKFDFAVPYAMLRLEENAPMHRPIQFNRFAALPPIEKRGSELAFSAHPR